MRTHQSRLGEIKNKTSDTLRSVKNLGLASTFAIASSFYLNACHNNPVEPIKNSRPESSLEVNPLFGISPLEVRIKGSATDPDGMKSYIEKVCKL